MNGTSRYISSSNPSVATLTGSSAVRCTNRPTPPVAYSNQKFRTSGDTSIKPSISLVPPEILLRVFDTQIADGFVVDQYLWLSGPRSPGNPSLYIGFFAKSSFSRTSMKGSATVGAARLAKLSVPPIGFIVSTIVPR